MIEKRSRIVGRAAARLAMLPMRVIGGRPVRQLLGPRRTRWLLASILGVLYRLGGNRATRLVLRMDWAVPDELNWGVVERVCRHGVSFDLHLDDNAQKTLFYTGWYERAFTEWLLSEVRTEDVYLDVGAHVGLSALVVAATMRDQGGAGRVIAVEPTPDSSQVIREGASRNGLVNVTVVERALGAEPGVVTLHSDDRYSVQDAGVRSKFNSGPPVCTVQMITADSLVDELGLHRVDLVKIDVEGSELDVLQGMTQTLKLLCPRAVVVEINEFRLRQAGTTREAIDSLLEEAGYRWSGQAFLENFVYRTRSWETLGRPRGGGI